MRFCLTGRGAQGGASAEVQRVSAGATCLARDAARPYITLVVHRGDAQADQGRRLGDILGT
jgi:hypothetical protein